MEHDIEHNRAHFGPRAANWDDRFHDDAGVYAAAITDLRVPHGGVAVDLGCGTARALAPLRDAVGPDGLAIGIDATPEMLAVARGKGRLSLGALVLADVTRLSLRARSVDAFFSAGLIEHVPDARALLRGMAASAASNCRMGVFMPIGRAVMAERHGNALQRDDLLDPSVLPGVLAETGWRSESIDDAETRYLAIATLA